MARRPSIPDHVKLEVWSKSGGRCQFRGCNKPLWVEGLTLAKINIGEMAHIIGASEQGPRGNERSQELAKVPANLMLVCKEHHGLLDHSQTRDRYPEELLKEMKTEHEARVTDLLEIHGEEYKTTFVTCMINIGERPAEISDKEIINAIYPRYREDEKGITYRQTNFNLRSLPEVWQAEARNISSQITAELKYRLDKQRIRHLSIFGLAPMPLLMWFGKCLGEIIHGNVHHAFRSKDNPYKWKWDEEPINFQSVEFSTTRLVEGSNPKNVVLSIAISDYLNFDKYTNLTDDLHGCSIYEISIKEPTPMDPIRKKADVIAFSKVFRATLNQIQKECGADSHIYIIPAMPACLAVQAGRSLLPTKDSNITVCQFFSEDQQFSPVLNLI